MAGKQIGKLCGTRISRLCLEQLCENFGGSGYVCDTDLYTFIFSDCIVEFIDQKIHGSIRLLAVNVPDGQCNGIGGIQQRFSAARILTSRERQKGEGCK